mmetsp:Transcript_17080/g.41332  ORF Transcript_17080/g.41332 Transcript_17080/m.41332 type:complete len:141 (-) Transcript_17080:165-587(-)
MMPPDFISSPYPYLPGSEKLAYSVACCACAGITAWAFSLAFAAYAAKEADHARRCAVGALLTTWAMMLLSLIVIQSWTQATLSPDAIHLACGMTVLTLFLGLVFTVIEAIVVVLRHHTPSASDTHSLPEFGVSGWLTERL